MNTNETFLAELKKRRDRTYDYIYQHRDRECFRPQHIFDAVDSYLTIGGKGLRPALMMLCCGAVGGDETAVLPAAAAIEIFHTWTLMHDDVIDRDLTRRSGLTAHENFRRQALQTWGLPPEEALHYGVSVAILAGDVLQGWVNSLLCDVYYESQIDPAITLFLIKELESNITTALVAGQMLDVQFTNVPLRQRVQQLTEQDIINMLRQKTAVLYGYAARAGATIGLQQTEHPYIPALVEFAELCGIGFQLQDDLLGIVADEQKLGKPVGSDIREGKLTMIVHHAIQQASEKQAQQLRETLGNAGAKPDQIEAVKQIFHDTGSLAYVKQRAQMYVKQGLDRLQTLPDSEPKAILSMWADYMIQRDF